MPNDMITHNRPRLSPAVLRQLRRTFRAKTGQGYYANSILPLDLGKMPPSLLRHIHTQVDPDNDAIALYQDRFRREPVPQAAQVLARFTDATVAHVTGGQKRRGTLRWFINAPETRGGRWHFDPLGEEQYYQNTPFADDIDARAPVSVQLLLQPINGQAMALPEPRTRVAAAALRRRIAQAQKDAPNYTAWLQTVDRLMRRQRPITLKPGHAYLSSGRVWHRGPYARDASVRGKPGAKRRVAVNAEYSWR